MAPLAPPGSAAYALVGGLLTGLYPHCCKALQAWCLTRDSSKPGPWTVDWSADDPYLFSVDFLGQGEAQHSR